MYLTAFLHRDVFFEIANRWLSNQLRPEDPLQITRIISYDSFVAWTTQLSFIDALSASLSHRPIHRKTISSKKELKDLICQAETPKTARIAKLIDEYMKTPEFFYIGSPFVGYIYHYTPSDILCISRLKRVRRIAEKSSRYAKMHIFDQIHAEAREISRKWPQPTSTLDGLPAALLTEAERVITDRIKEQGLSLPLESMTIKDVLGMKIIDRGYGEKGLESTISGLTGARIVEKENHTGRYNAVHYVVELDVHKKQMINEFSALESTLHFTQRGLPADGLREDFSAFITTGADRIQVDLIFTSFDELIESEIGRSIHENRIFEQRQQKRYYGNILNSIEYIIEYLFAVGLSPATEIGEIPIKIWGRYLPDTLSHQIRELYQMPEYSLISA
ncbi:MAG: hypothetical protein ABII06_22425 [Pseudomonadota bacterium]